MISAKDALEISRDNPHARWNGVEGAAAERIAQRIIVPQARQSFRAKPGDSFFAIGSCFARNVEERLHLAGSTVTSLDIDVRNLGNNNAREGGVFNKYTPVSILQELKWATGIESYPEQALLPTADGQFLDPYLSGKAAQGSKYDMMVRRTEVGRYFAKALQADVVILTLGLIETWVDTVTGLHLNEAPNPRILARNAERFRFHQLSFEEVEAALEEIRQVLEAHGKPGQKRVLTVSPVPLGRTFTADDVVVANATSKATLRAAATRLTARAQDMDYFPSYEAVSLSDPNLSWQQDRRHVSDVVVGQIIQTFLVRYGVSGQPAEDLAGAISALESDPSFQAWAAQADNQEALLARLNQEVNKYKNMVLRLQKELRDVVPR
jgi:hypothetical protein